MITAAPNAPAGQVRALPSFDRDAFLPTDAVLCRNTAPLVAFAFKALRRRLGVTILGRDIAAGLRRTVEDCMDTTGSIDFLRAKLDSHERAETTRAMKHENAAAVAAIRDRYAALRCFTADAKSAQEVLRTIEDLFRPAAGVLTLGTMHKAKGLEWNRVFILDQHLCPSPWATQPWQRDQERCLMHVAVTRARDEVIYISSEGWTVLASAIPQGEGKGN